MHARHRGHFSACFLITHRRTNTARTLPASAFKNPAVALSGVVDYSMYVSFRQQFDNAAAKDLLVIELSTLGGDPEVARMMGEDVRFASETEPARRFVVPGQGPRSIPPAPPSWAFSASTTAI